MKKNTNKNIENTLKTRDQNPWKQKNMKPKKHGKTKRMQTP